MNNPFSNLLDGDGNIDENELKTAFLSRLQDQENANAMFDDALQEYEGEELLQICGEIVQTIHAECNADDFHNWDYDHLEFIIDLSNRYGFVIPRNLLNGLPEQLIILVDAGKLGDPGCD